ncbi:MAG: pyruvate dehydrogenase [Bdellovibrionales bacterium]|nr:pyruvate dehydrogenase [Bdellovibrionales bacterium]
MIYVANHRENIEKGDPKVGGHSSASSSSIHILGALHLVVKTGFDHMAIKPHASPADHAFNYLLDLFINKNGTRLAPEQSENAMHNLRSFPLNEEFVFQSYHSSYDPDHHNYLPSGTVGIPPVNAGYLALAYRYAEKHGYKVPKAHFWSLIGDSEFREGSLHEAIPDFAERELGNLTWIIDYNRQSLDGHRITNKGAMHGTDDQRIERSMIANGWEVLQVRHGKHRLELFKKTDGDKFQQLLEKELTDYELQVLLQFKTGLEVRQELLSKHAQLKNFLKKVSDQELWQGLRDFGGHDISQLVAALEQSQLNQKKPTLIIAHTLKGWNLNMAASPGNHSSLPDKEEMEHLRKTQGITNLFEKFKSSSEESLYLKKRGDKLFADIQQQKNIREENLTLFSEIFASPGEFPSSMEINLKLASYPHTQWMLGQLTAKLTRIANTLVDSHKSKNENQKTLNPLEKSFKLPAEMFISMAPDVGTSTNLNPAMDGKIYGSAVVEDLEKEFGVKDKGTPDLVPGEEVSDRFLRFEIAEANVMSCVGSFGRMLDLLGLPLLPLMTVYDFFVKRAHDQYFYNLYWKSSFILVGTPSGVTLSPEGAQHGWKSDFQIPNQITWEPFFCQELDWIFVDAIRRHFTQNNVGRTGVFIRGSTRGVEQKDFLYHLRTQKRFKSDESQIPLLPKGMTYEGCVDESTLTCQSDNEILTQIRMEVLEGAYSLINYQGYSGYEPGDNVVHIFAMGSLGTEAIKASKTLLEKGIYANVIIVTSPDLLVGNLGYENNYKHLLLGLGVNSQMYFNPHMNGTTNVGEVITLAGRRIPIVSVHDGEAGLLDNIGSIVGVKQISLAVRKHSRCGRPSDIYSYHHIDALSIIEACGQVLAQTSLEKVTFSRKLINEVLEKPQQNLNWQELWPKNTSH